MFQRKTVIIFSSKMQLFIFKEDIVALQMH